MGTECAQLWLMTSSFQSPRSSFEVLQRSFLLRSASLPVSVYFLSSREIAQLCGLCSPPGLNTQRPKGISTCYLPSGPISVEPVSLSRAAPRRLLLLATRFRAQSTEAEECTWCTHLPLLRISPVATTSDSEAHSLYAQHRYFFCLRSRHRWVPQ